MILNKKNWFARYYNWVTGKYPKDVCSFFWGSITFILLSPFIFVGRLIPDACKSANYLVVMQTSKGLVTLFLVGLLSFILGSLGNAVLGLFGYKFIYVWVKILGGIGLGILTIALLVVLVIGIYKLFMLTKRGVGYVVPETHIIDNTVDFIGAIKGKYCTKITWKD